MLKSISVSKDHHQYQIPSMKFIHKIVIRYFFGLGLILSVLSSIIMFTLIPASKSSITGILYIYLFVCLYFYLYN